MEFNLGAVNEAVVAAVPDREAIVWRDRRLTYRQLGDRTRRLANYLLGQGFEVSAERADLASHQSGQDHLALYLHNGNEYLEGMIGAYKARVAPFNVNYRYVAEELHYLLDDSRAKGIVFHSAFAPTLREVLDKLPNLTTLLQVRDESGHDLLDGAIWYEDALEQSPATAPAVALSPDDLYILYTGGTTGMPKGVLWRQADIFPAALGGRDLSTGNEWTSFEAIVESALNGGSHLLPAPPFMHGAAHWIALNALGGGSTVVLPNLTDRLDPVDVWSTVEREGVNIALIVGDAFGRPLVDELREHDYELGSLILLVSGGAALSATVKREFLELLPGMSIMDGLGASETGSQAAQITGAGAGATTSTGTFTPGPGMCILDETVTALVEVGDEQSGWLAQRGRVPLGYLGDEAKTSRTFPVIDGVRFAVPGDRARYTSGGLLDLQGRDSATINSGGEKIFAEEVEAAIGRHPAVYDVVVAGRPSERWGNEVVAIVRLRDQQLVTSAELLAECGQHIARYKLPKEIKFVDHIERSPSGKADYRWARQQAIGVPETD
ncbi:MAG: acyl-CoA synthetase [Actinomycetes bacterium]